MICREHGQILPEDAVRDLITHYCNHGHGNIDMDELSVHLCPVCREELIDGIECSYCGDEHLRHELFLHSDGNLYCHECYVNQCAIEMVTTTIDVLIAGLKRIGIDETTAEGLIKDALY